MKELDLEQGTKQWLEARKGKITGTRLKDVLKADNLPVIYEMIAELGSDEIEETFTTKAMERGKNCEPIAISLYQHMTGVVIDSVGFCISEDNEMLALSPDGFTADRTGAVEVKSPNTATHVKYILGDRIPSEYLAQVMNYFLVNTKLDWLDFISFDDRYRPKPIWIKRVYRHELKDQLVEVNEKLDKFITKFSKYYEKIIF
jgi:exodeoxyribonuclease (lambda-induced)